ncbi:MAG: hypothetical protein A2007_05250 [Verrucomicrobia bacterium GWC2_42_7]|nr:MAG: hypothetical protein A2007_05250 [Verrucomicrobia bacterium GWC2_42_7]
MKFWGKLLLVPQKQFSPSPFPKRSYFAKEKSERFLLRDDRFSWESAKTWTLLKTLFLQKKYFLNELL